MYSEELKEKIIELCWNEKTFSFTKHTKSIGASIKSNIFKIKALLMNQDTTFVCKKGVNIETGHIYECKKDKEVICVLIKEKLSENYSFEVDFDNDKIRILCEMYRVERA